MTVDKEGIDIALHMTNLDTMATRTTRVQQDRGKKAHWPQHFH